METQFDSLKREYDQLRQEKIKTISHEVEQKIFEMLTKAKDEIMEDGNYKCIIRGPYEDNIIDNYFLKYYANHIGLECSFDTQTESSWLNSMHGSNNKIMCEVTYCVLSLK